MNKYSKLERIAEAHKIRVLGIDVSQEVLDLIAEVEALRKDAERYRWLRDSDRLSLWSEHLVCDEPRRSNGIDKHIDAAISNEAKDD